MVNKLKTTKSLFDGKRKACLWPPSSKSLKQTSLHTKSVLQPYGTLSIHQNQKVLNLMRSHKYNNFVSVNIPEC